VFAARRIHRPAIASALACALLASAMGGTAATRPNQRTQVPRRSRRSATTPVTARRRPSTPARPLRSGKTCAAPTPATLRSSPRAGMRRPPGHCHDGRRQDRGSLVGADRSRLRRARAAHCAAAAGAVRRHALGGNRSVHRRRADHRRRERDPTPPTPHPPPRRPSQELGAPDHWRPTRPPRRAPYPRPSHPHPPRRNGAPSHRCIATVLGESHARLSPLRRQGHAHDLPVPQAGRDRRSLHAAVDRWPSRAARAYRDPLPLRANERASPLGHPRHLLGTTRSRPDRCRTRACFPRTE